MGGRVEKIHVRPGQTVKVGQVLVSFGEGGAPAGAAARRQAGRRHARSHPHARAGAEDGGRGQRARGQAAPRRPNAAREAPSAPVATRRRERTARCRRRRSTRRLARELGVDLRAVNGSGPGGRVTDDDVRAAARRRHARPVRRPASARSRHRGDGSRPPSAPAVAKPLAARRRRAAAAAEFEQWGPVERQPLSHLRRTIAERMTLSATLIPHVTHFDRADITDLDALIRRNLEAGKARGVTLTLTSFLLKAVAQALGEHPHFNASLDPAAGELIVKRYVHLGVAVAAERGLIVPVIRDVDQKPLLELQRELGALAQRVREGKATLEDLRGGTFTVTNIGALGGTGAIPIINYPEVAILGVARGREEPVVRDGAIVPAWRWRPRVGSSFRSFATSTRNRCWRCSASWARWPRACARARPHWRICAADVHRHQHRRAWRTAPFRSSTIHPSSA